MSYITVIYTVKKKKKSDADRDWSFAHIVRDGQDLRELIT